MNKMQKNTMNKTGNYNADSSDWQHNYSHDDDISSIVQQEWFWFAASAIVISIPVIFFG